jgi:hypothetical protein
VAANITETMPHQKDDAQVEDRSATDPQTLHSGSAPKRSLHAGTIVQLESWLKSIERQRRDRVISGDLDS